MKTIYTVTFHKANNYGALLQAYALQKIIEKKYLTEILDYDNKFISNGYKVFKNVNGSIKIRATQLAKDIVNLKKEVRRVNKFNEFRNEFKISEKIDSVDDLMKDKYKDCIFITGSDQVWNPDITSGLDPIYTLNFNNNIKRISYAASAGHNQSLNTCKNDLIDIVKNYDFISVREDSLKELLSSELPNHSIDCVLDPTLLLSKEEWEMVAGDTRLIKEKYIFVYCGEEPDYFYDIVNKIANDNNYIIAYFGRRDRKNKFKGRKKSCYEYGPKEFVNLIKYAECVVTVSFHGTALACILNKEMFIVLNRYPDRLKTLLERINLSDRMIKSLNEYDSISNEVINWEVTNQLIEKEKNISTQWLYNAISKSTGVNKDE